MCLSVNDSSGELLGCIYLDLFATGQKQEGAWVLGYEQRMKKSDASTQLPSLFLTLNLEKNNHGAVFLTLDQVRVLFHETGHALHYLLGESDWAHENPTRRSSWDAVEVPSLFLEKLARQPQVLHRLSSHYITGESMPLEDIEQRLQTNCLFPALSLLESVDLSLTDLRMHQAIDVSFEQLQTITKETSIENYPLENRPSSFLPLQMPHLFSGHYGSQYYTYLWSQAIASSLFEKYRDDLQDIRPGEAALMNMRREFFKASATTNSKDLIHRLLGKAPNANVLIRSAETSLQ